MPCCETEAQVHTNMATKYDDGRLDIVLRWCWFPKILKFESVIPLISTEILTDGTEDKFDSNYTGNYLNIQNRYFKYSNLLFDKT
ncbi:hypothetical protein Y1Q_0004023 [Alligator mississippiensis]|uniref:Uncharacterized protein n=1 Tax=Alligator mississippiensis TaxID=8496 RepID=A0A151PIL5_ALLMI|nr:hypothetical protein Y1Q_0004023 [Alligator mississippiensis]